MNRARALVVCPGRGSYGRDQLGSLAAITTGTDIVEVCDRWRLRNGRPTLRELDGAERFRPSLHLAGEHASLLTFAVSLVDAAHLDTDQFEIVGITGNSMGWYTALTLAGALSLSHGVELVDTMGAYQANHVIGGQVMMPRVDADWQPDPALRNAIDDAVATVRAEGHVCETSIDLGSFVVLGADGAGVQRLLEVLPATKRGSRSFPTRLPNHSAFHTSLMRKTSARAFGDLAHLTFEAPTVPLVDGRGHLFRPRSTDPAALRDYTLGHQVTAAYDFACALRTALRHCAPDVVIALGPGNSLGGPIAYGLVTEGWRGVRTRDALGDAALLRSFGVADQRRSVVA